MMTNITKLFGFGGIAEETAAPEGYDVRCEPGNCNGEGDFSYYEMVYNTSRGGWFYSGTCC